MQLMMSILFHRIVQQSARSSTKNDGDNISFGIKLWGGHADIYQFFYVSSEV